ADLEAAQAPKTRPVDVAGDVGAVVVPLTVGLDHPQVGQDQIQLHILTDVAVVGVVDDEVLQLAGRDVVQDGRGAVPVDHRPAAGVVQSAKINAARHQAGHGARQVGDAGDVVLDLFGHGAGRRPGQLGLQGQLIID